MSQPYPEDIDLGLVRACIEDALSALGTGACLENTCEGCKADEEAARDSLREALELLGGAA